MANSETQFDVEKLAHLARLELTDDERATYSRQLGDVLEYIDEIATMPIQLSAEAAVNVAPHHELNNITRSDSTVDDGIETAELLANAPMSEGTAIKVHAVLGAQDE
jgi:aspartyl-tRNA(Asn)/glutamyl-tRNA(Gln) amidotransferase subunit C